MSNPAPSFTDFIVIGSGPVGSAFARAVRERSPQATILMIEAGPRILEPPGMNVRNLSAADRVEPQRRSEGHLGRSADHPATAEAAVTARPGTHLVSVRPKGVSLQDDMPGAALSTNVGGMGAHWTCAVPRPGDSERIPFIDAAELDAALSAAEKYLSASTAGFTPTAASNEVMAKLSAMFADTHRPVQPMPLACQPRDHGLPRWAGADVVLGDLCLSTDGSAGFTLLDNTLCRRILFDGPTAVGVELQDLSSGAVSSVRASAIAVAADALRTPQLLWASGVRLPALGRYLNDQPQIISAVYLDGVTDTDKAATSEPTDARDSLTGVCWVPFTDQHPFHVQVMQMDASPIQVGNADPTEGRPVVGIGFFCAKTGRKSDQVELSDTETDDYGMPALTIHYRLDEQDRTAIAAAESNLRRVAGELGEFVPGGEPQLLPAGSSLHYQGTTRMGPADNGTSVCDDHSLVWGYNNLYVGGNGVIPTATACNPTLTSVAMAIRAADVIAAQLDTPITPTIPVRPAHSPMRRL